MATTTTLVLISVFVLIYICTVYALGQSELRDVRFALAFPVSVLCVLGFLRGGDVQEKPILDSILIPYQALACTLVLIVILLILFLLRLRIQKVFKWRKYPESERKCRKCHRKVIADPEKESPKAQNKKQLEEENTAA